ncbi:MAG: PEP-CTERM sorting domain-containing protein [Pirellulales bacterium]
MQHILTIVVLLGLAVTASTRAATITVGDHFLEPNMAGQRITISVAGGDVISGLNLFAQVGDGGPELALLPNPLPPGTDGPAIATVDFFNGTVFAGLPDQPTDLGSIPQVAIWSMALTGPMREVSADGTLVRLTIDTTGFLAGSWDLLLANVLPDLGPFDTNFAGAEADVIDSGTISLGTLVGDVDFNGKVDFDDISSFATGLSDPVAYTSQFGVSPLLRGDTNADQQFDFDDIADFVQILSGNGTVAATSTVPEPATAWLLMSGVLTAAFGGSSRFRQRQR